ncbi:MAG: GGDEF domain-containing protein [Halioglobus sp.]|nr:GGDEF domain-containing protein [Halioglobus sp.]
MEQLHPDSWAILHFGLIFLITLAQMTVVYVLSDASNPTPGLGLYTVYFMAALLGWIAFTLQQLADVPMVIDVPSVAAILNSYLLFLAAGERAEMRGGRIPLGAVCLAASLSVFFVTPSQMWVVQTLTAAFFFSSVAVLCALRAYRRRNVGDGITATAAVIMVIGVAFAHYRWHAAGEYTEAQAMVFGFHTLAYVLVALGFLASVVIEYQQHLAQLATQDPLTRLLNRRGLETALQMTLAQAARQQSPTAAIKVDIDSFKEINDNFGHDTGDYVIREVARYLQQATRGSDVVARTAGEEFLVILPETTLDGARVLAERMREVIAAEPLQGYNHSIPTTISLGVAATVGEVDIDQLSQEADRAMYLAKRGGRNRVASVENKPIHLRTSASPGQA